MPPIIYLDNNATTRPTDEVVSAMDDVLREHWANPSSVHRPGQAVRQRVELARESVARLLGVSGAQIVFVSCGTEAIALAIRGTLATRAPGRRVVVTTKIEHSAVRELVTQLTEQGRVDDVEVEWLPVSRDGVVELDALGSLLAQRADEIAIVSTLWANNETGVVQPVSEIGTLCREHGVRFHCDAVQAVGKIPVDVGATPVDLLTLSAHKFQGPKGVGALVTRRGVRVMPLLAGHQERERRAGTENVPGIVGLGVAADQAVAWLATDERHRLASLRDRFERAIAEQVGEATVNANDAERLWNTTNIAFARLEAEAILMLLSERGVCASAGAACSSGSLDPSPVLLAMGIEPALAHGSVRFSLSRETTDEEVDRAVDIVAESIERLRASMPGVA